MQILVESLWFIGERREARGKRRKARGKKNRGHNLIVSPVFIYSRIFVGLFHNSTLRIILNSIQKNMEITVLDGFERCVLRSHNILYRRIDRLLEINT